jgi:NAD(P)-dependent dehydrogenase (short-subunit alcohol dehydrogenase family)
MGDRKIAVVIGGANGIGAACCEVMAAHDWRPMVVDLDIAAAEATAERAGGQAFALDVRDEAAIRDLAARIERDVGVPEALVVSSGIFQGNVPVEDTPADTFATLTAVNLGGTYHANRAFGERMAANGRGSIVNLASVTGHGSTPLNVYGPGKAAIIMMSKSFAGEWGGRGVRVNSVSPGVTLVPRIIERKRAGNRYPPNLDDQMALRRCVEPKEVAEAVEFLASARASAITGVDLVVDCGWLVGGLWGAYGGMR